MNIINFNRKVGSFATPEVGQATVVLDVGVGCSESDEHSCTVVIGLWCMCIGAYISTHSHTDPPE